MSVALSFDLDGLTPKEAKVLASMILAYVETKYGAEEMGERELPEFPAPDPASVFPLSNVPPPPPEEPSKLSASGPVLVIPNPPAPVIANAISSQSQEIVSSAPAVGPVAQGTKLDSTGLPWDNRIHASTKTTNADGKWKKRKGVDAAEVTVVEAQLRQVLAIPSVHASLPQQVQQVSQVLQGITAPPPPPVDENAVQQAYIELWGKSQAAIASGAINLDQIKTICESVGIAGLPLLALRLDLVPRVSQLIDAVIKGQR